MLVYTFHGVYTCCVSLLPFSTCIYSNLEAWVLLDSWIGWLVWLPYTHDNETRDRSALSYPTVRYILRWIYRKHLLIVALPVIWEFMFSCIPTREQVVEQTSPRMVYMDIVLLCHGRVAGGAVDLTLPTYFHLTWDIHPFNYAMEYSYGHNQYHRCKLQNLSWWFRTYVIVCIILSLFT